ncbi:MAG: zinc-binding alcohol dehydrogenase [Alphaproteobacteria bacterium]|nr:zinc-binding alcohol dehydrogenase [Alphaproteobacteria bacterium]
MAGSDPGTRGARALWYVAARRAELRPAAVVDPGADPGAAGGTNWADAAVAEVRTSWSAVSRGTERLVFEGRVGASEYARMRAPLQEGAFPFPVKYGYCAVGVVAAGPGPLVGRRVFVLHPHQDRFACPAAMAVPVPDAVPARRATLGANMETALNALWDAGAGPGDRIVVVGAGVVGLLVAYLAARLPGARVTVVDIEPARAAIAEALGAAFALPDAVAGEADLVFHASASAAGLATAIAAAGEEAMVVELSWYGDGTVAAPLGGAFHSRRLTLRATQVGQLPPAKRPRWTHARRLAAALALLEDPRLDALITGEVAFADLPAALPALLAPAAPGLVTVVRYD